MSIFRWDPRVASKRTTVEPVPLLVDFDNPHVGAGVLLRGQYPSGVIDWGQEEWEVYPPGGRMATFSIGTAGANSTQRNFDLRRRRSSCEPRSIIRWTKKSY